MKCNPDVPPYPADFAIITCDICGKPFTPEEWEDQHWPHEPDCTGGDGLGCDCDIVCHARCCPECNKEADR